MSKQEQHGGIGSTNFQIGSISTGMSYSDVRDIAKDVFETNFQRLAAAAREVANERAQEIRDEIVNALSERRIEELASFEQPATQMALFDAQKAYALSGDAELKEALVNMVVDLSKETQRSTKAIVLQEAIKAAPTLNSAQITAISIVFLYRYVQFNGAANLMTLSNIFGERLGRELEHVDVTAGDLRHIEYTRCGIVELGEISFGELLRRKYSGLVSIGYTKELIIEAFGEFGIPPEAVMPHLYPMLNQAPEPKYQIAALNQHVLEEKAREFGWSSDQLRIAGDRLNDPNSLMDDSKALSIAHETGGAIRKVASLWQEANLKQLKLTSVGIAIAHARTIASKGDPADLSIWL